MLTKAIPTLGLPFPTETTKTNISKPNPKKEKAKHSNPSTIKIIETSKKRIERNSFPIASIFSFLFFVTQNLSTTALRHSGSHLKLRVFLLSRHSFHTSLGHT